MCKTCKHCNCKTEQELLGRLTEMGFYISQRGEGALWILHAPNGKWRFSANTRQSVIDYIRIHYNF